MPPTRYFINRVIPELYELQGYYKVPQSAGKDLDFS